MDQVKNLVSTGISSEQSYATVFAAIALFYSAYRLIHSSNNQKTIEGTREIPMPDGRYPLFGHMLTLGNRPSAKVTEWHKKYGPIIQIKMGVQTWILVDDPQLAHKIFVTHGIETSYRPYSTYVHKYYGHGKGIAFSNPGSGGVWQQGRSAALSVLGPKQVQKYADSIEKEATQLAVSLIDASSSSSDGVDPLKYLELCAMNFLLNASFGKKFTSIDDPEFKNLTHLVEYSANLAGPTKDLASFVPSLAFIDYLSGSQSEMKRFIEQDMIPTFENLIKEARAKETPNLVKNLDEGGHHLDEEGLRVIMSDLIGGGTDTTAVTLSWNLALMCHYPEVQQKAAEEIDAFIKLHGHVPTFEDREYVPYCISVMKECLRFKPVSPFGVPRSVQKSVVIDGYVFPKDCTILTSMESLHANAASYQDPEIFNPDRFINNQKTMQSAANGRLEDRDHYNFGWGRRICPGIYLAEMEIFNIFVQLLARCKIEPAKELPFIDEANTTSLTLSPNRYKAKFVKRTNALV